MSDGNVKRVAIKFVGGARPTETLAIAAGATTRDVLRQVGLDNGGFQLSDSTGARVFGLEDAIFALVSDGDLLYASALVDAGHREVAA